MTIEKSLKGLVIVPLMLIAAIAEAASMTVSPASLSVAVKQSATISISNASGTVRIENSNPDVASASLSANVVTVTGKSVGTSTIKIKDRRTTLSVPVSVIPAVPALNGNTDGRLLASNCFQCHGTYGSGGFESLIGKNDIYAELSEYLSGHEDPDGIMAAHLKGYTQEQLQAISDYLANP